jgi:hypothetical protein
MKISHERCPGSGKRAKPQLPTGMGSCPKCRRGVCVTLHGLIYRHNTPIPDREREP